MRKYYFLLVTLCSAANLHGMWSSMFGKDANQEIIESLQNLHSKIDTITTRQEAIATRLDHLEGRFEGLQALTAHLAFATHINDCSKEGEWCNFEFLLKAISNGVNKKFALSQLRKWIGAFDEDIAASIRAEAGPADDTAYFSRFVDKVVTEMTGDMSAECAQLKAHLLELHAALTE